MRVNGFEFLSLQPNYIGYNESKSIRFLSAGKSFERSTYEVLQILSISLTDKTYLVDLFNKTNFNDVKELDGPLIPGLFD